MSNTQVVYSDRLVNISLHNGLVRMDLAVITGQVKDKDDKPAQRMEITTQVVMPLDAFANAVGMQDKLLKEVIARADKARSEQQAVSAESTTTTQP